MLLYLESFGNPRKFARIARRGEREQADPRGQERALARRRARDLLAHRRAALGLRCDRRRALPAGGVIRTDTMHELFDVAALLSASRPPGRPRRDRHQRGRPGDHVRGRLPGGWRSRSPSCPTRLRAAALPRLLPPEARFGNPIDMIATAPRRPTVGTIEVARRGGVCDAIIAIFVPPLVTDAVDVAPAIRVAAARPGDVPIAAVFMTAEGARPSSPAAACASPSFDFPEDAARALAHAARYGRWRARPAGTVPRLSTAPTRERAAAIIARRSRRRATPGSRAEDVLSPARCYGLPLIATRSVARCRRCGRRGRASSAAGRAEGDRDRPDSQERRGRRPPRPRRSAARSARGARDRGSVSARRTPARGPVVQPMAEPGVELLVGVVHDESFGPVIACGAGGTSVELLHDAAVRITPLTDVDAAEMLRSLRDLPAARGLPRVAAAVRYRGGRAGAAAPQRARRRPPRDRRARRQPPDRLTARRFDRRCPRSAGARARARAVPLAAAVGRSRGV